MDKIKVVIRMSPLLIDVIDLKPAIRWHKVGLDGREINTKDLCRWMQIGKFTAIIRISANIKMSFEHSHGPNASAATQVQDPLRQYLDGRFM